MSAKIDWQYLGEKTLFPAMSLLVASICLAVSFWFRNAEVRVYEMYTADHDAIYQDYDAMMDRRRILDRYHRRYAELQEQGFVGRERRLDWIETIRSTAKELDLPNVSYSLEPQVEAIHPVASTSPDADVEIHLSLVELELGLVHEADLLRFFGRLELEAPGLMKVDQCTLTRQFSSEQLLSADTNILASCSMAMFSVITSDIDTITAENVL